MMLVTVFVIIYSAAKLIVLLQSSAKVEGFWSLSSGGDSRSVKDRLKNVTQIQGSMGSVFREPYPVTLSIQVLFIWGQSIYLGPTFGNLEPQGYRQLPRPSDFRAPYSFVRTYKLDGCGSHW